VLLKVVELRGGEHRQRQAHGLASQGAAQQKPPVKFGGNIEIS
jgi:hypothetical protein